MNGEEVLTNTQLRVSVLPLMVLGGLALLLVVLTSCANNSYSSRQKTLRKLQEQPQSKKIPVIFDTDIGDDIDDTWALGLLLQSPEFDVKLITTAVDDTSEKAKTVAKMLEIADRADIPVGVGVPVYKHGKKGNKLAPWTEDYKLSSYPGVVYQDGVQALIETIMSADEPITLIAVGPLPNIAAAIEREPRIAEKAKFVGMHGSIRRGYEGRAEVSKEYNVAAFPKEAQKVFTSRWHMTITPLDTCGIVKLKAEKYRKVLESKNLLPRAIIESYRVWTKSQTLEDTNVSIQSTTLYDTVAVYLAISNELLHMEKLGIRVTDDGYMIIDDKAKSANCAMKWKDLDAFEDFLVERLTK